MAPKRTKIAAEDVAKYADTGVLQELLGFLYAECRTRNRAVKPESIVSVACCK